MNIRNHLLVVKITLNNPTIAVKKTGKLDVLFDVNVILINIHDLAAMLDGGGDHAVL